MGRKRKGQILVENTIFLILNLIFLVILVLFVVSRTGDASFVEEKYAKQIALLIDSAEPGMSLTLNVEDALKIAKENNFDEQIINKRGNGVFVKLREKGGYGYYFFNDVDVNIYPDKRDEEIKSYIITINDYN